MKLPWFYGCTLKREAVQIARDRFVDKFGVESDTIVFRPEEAPERIVFDGLQVETGLVWHGHFVLERREG